ncbi:MAG: hypothetical protein AAGG00_06415 [Cyanobacteria bacterium P01_H01_bin.150]
MKIVYFLSGCFATLTVIYFADNAFVYQDKFGTIPQQWGERVTLISLSPNDKNRVSLVETPNFIDRNFEVRLQRQGESNFTKIFRVTDVSKPVGSERIIWSTDSSKFGLFGRHLTNTKFLQDFKIENYGILYFVYDLNTKKAYCHRPISSKYDSIYNCLPMSSDLMKIFY